MKIADAQVQTEIDRMQSSLEDSIADQLNLWGWGRWAGRELSELGYPPCLIRFVAKGSWEKDLRKIPALPSEEEAMRIDAAVSRLPLSHRKVILTKYKACVPHRKLPEVLGWSESRVKQLHSEAVGMLWAFLREG